MSKLVAAKWPVKALPRQTTQGGRETPACHTCRFVLALFEPVLKADRSRPSSTRSPDAAWAGARAGHRSAAPGARRKNGRDAKRSVLGVRARRVGARRRSLRGVLDRHRPVRRSAARRRRDTRRLATARHRVRAGLRVGGGVGTRRAPGGGRRCRGDGRAGTPTLSGPQLRRGRCSPAAVPGHHSSMQSP